MLRDESTIEINGREYTYAIGESGSYVRLYCGDPFGDNFEIYDVALMADWLECTCGDFTFRGSKTGRQCKHIVACRECGLI